MVTVMVLINHMVSMVVVMILMVVTVLKQSVLKVVDHLQKLLYVSSIRDKHLVFLSLNLLKYLDMLKLTRDL